VKALLTFGCIDGSRSRILKFEMFLDPDLDSKILEKNPGRCLPKVHFFGPNWATRKLRCPNKASKDADFPCFFFNKHKQKIASLG